MGESHWLTIVGIEEDGPDGLSAASQEALAAAEIIIGARRHLDLLPDGLTAEKRQWPIPFADGVADLLALRGRTVVALASGDPFWFGAGTVLARQLGADEWLALPGRSVFSLAANRLGWALETTHCLGLHAAPLARLYRYLFHGQRLLVLLRDGAAVTALADYLTAAGFGASSLIVLEALGGPRARRTDVTADLIRQNMPATGFAHPLCVAIDLAGAEGGAGAKSGREDGRSCASGQPDHLFDHDGQITKQPIRAMVLSALAPRPSERLWDIGGGSGAVAIDWLLAHPSMQAVAIEQRQDRATRIRTNAARWGVDHLDVIEGPAPQALEGLPPPDAVFIGGGLCEELLVWLSDHLGAGTRLVANAVTLESEMLLLDWQARLGGDLLRVALSRPTPLGEKRGWQAAYPIVQWRVTL